MKFVNLNHYLTAKVIWINSKFMMRPMGSHYFQNITNCTYMLSIANRLTRHATSYIALAVALDSG